MSSTNEITVRRVMAYIRHDNRLLVFRHTQHPEAGIQVPGGTVEPGEAIEEAVLREAWEETGLEGLEIGNFLGIKLYDRAQWGLEGVEERHFFELVLNGPVPERWIHYEMTPSDGSPGPIEFEFYWVDLPENVPELAGGQGDFLHKL